MTVTKNVIEDLIPVYVAGEASSDTRTLVDEFVALHPEMREKLTAVDLPAAKGEPPRELGLRALGETRKLIASRNAWLGWAVGLSFAVFSFAFRGKEFVFVLFRDAPASAYLLLALGALCYFMFYRTCRRLVVTGLGAPHSMLVWGAVAAAASIPFTTVVGAHMGWESMRGLAAPAAFAGMALANHLNRQGR